MKSATAFEPDDVRLMGGACDEAWKILRTAWVRSGRSTLSSRSSASGGRFLARRINYAQKYDTFIYDAVGPPTNRAAQLRTQHGRQSRR